MSELDEAVQTYANSVNSSGPSTKPWVVPVLGVRCWTVDLDSVRSIQDLLAEGGTEA